MKTTKTFNIKPLSFVVCAFCCTYIYGSTNLSKLDSAVKYIYNFQFQEARNYINRVNFTDGYEILPIAYSHYWEYLSGNEAEFNLKICNDYLKLKKEPDSNDSLYAAYQVSEKLLQIRVDIARSNYIAPLMLFDDIKAYFEDHEPDINNDFSMLYWGLYNYYVTYARNNYFPAKYLLNNWPESSKRSGINLLESLSNSSSVFVNTEASYFLVRIYLESENNLSKASYHAKKLIRMYPNNYVYKLFLLKILLEQEDSETFCKTKKHFATSLLENKELSIQIKKHFTLLFSKL